MTVAPHAAPRASCRRSLTSAPLRKRARGRHGAAAALALASTPLRRPDLVARVNAASCSRRRRRCAGGRGRPSTRPPRGIAPKGGRRSCRTCSSGTVAAARAARAAVAVAARRLLAGALALVARRGARRLALVAALPAAQGAGTRAAALATATSARSTQTPEAVDRAADEPGLRAHRSPGSSFTPAGRGRQPGGGALQERAARRLQLRVGRASRAAAARAARPRRARASAIVRGDRPGAHDPAAACCDGSRIPPSHRGRARREASTPAMAYPRIDLPMYEPLVDRLGRAVPAATST